MVEGVDPVPDIHVLKLRRCEAALSSWFALFANQPPQEHAIVLFLSLVDILAEIYLLLKYSGPRPSVATLTFAASVENRRQTGKVLDYFSGVNSARAATELPKNGHPTWIRKAVSIRINSKPMDSKPLTQSVSVTQITSSKVIRTQSRTVERPPLNTTPQQISSTAPPEEVPDCLSVGEMATLRELEKKWEARSTIFRHTTSSYQQLKRRFLWVLAIAAEERTEEFEAFRDQRDWSATKTAIGTLSSHQRHWISR